MFNLSILKRVRCTMKLNILQNKLLGEVSEKFPSTSEGSDPLMKNSRLLPFERLLSYCKGEFPNSNSLGRPEVAGPPPCPGRFR